MDFFRLRIILSLVVLFLNITSSSTLPKDKVEPRLSIVDWDQYSTREEDGEGTYAFGYDIEDAETNNIQTRSEERYPNGTVVGTYGYVQPDGNVLMVNYIADVLGYRATIETNPRGVLKPIKVDTLDFRTKGNFPKRNKNEDASNKESSRLVNSQNNPVNYDYEEINNYEGVDQEPSYQDVAYSVYEPSVAESIPYPYYASPYHTREKLRVNSPSYQQNKDSSIPVRYFLFRGENS